MATTRLDLKSTSYGNPRGKIPHTHTGCQKARGPSQAKSSKKNTVRLIPKNLTGRCSTPTQLLICSSFNRENGHPLLICSSLSTAQLRNHVCTYRTQKKQSTSFRCSREGVWLPFAESFSRTQTLAKFECLNLPKTKSEFWLPKNGAFFPFLGLLEGLCSGAFAVHFRECNKK